MQPVETAKKGRPRKAINPDRRPGKGGNPPAKIDLETLEQLGQIRCTLDEAAAFLKVSPACLDLRLKQGTPEREAWDRGQNVGKMSLRRLQFNAAKEGNTTMLVWLGKQWLGQRDKHEHENSGGIQIVITPEESEL